MSDETQATGSETETRTESVFTKVIRFIFRLLIVVVIGVVLGVAVYYAVPAIYRSAIEPIQSNTQRVAELESDLALTQDTMKKQAEQAGEQLAEIEGQLAAQSESLAALQAAVEGLQMTTEDQRDQIVRLRNVADQVRELTSDFDKAMDRLEAVEETLAEENLPAEHIEQQLQIIRAMTMLTRARLWLVQDNLGLAAEEITTARDLVAKLAETQTEDDNELLLQIVERLDLALEAVRTKPIVAADELEIAWKLLVEATEP